MEDRGANLLVGVTEVFTEILIFGLSLEEKKEV